VSRILGGLVETSPLPLPPPLSEPERGGGWGWGEVDDPKTLDAPGEGGKAFLKCKN
jgi:hypothetical protein